MKLSEALAKGPQKPRRAAFPESVKGDLPPAEFEALVAILGDTEWSAPSIRSLLKENGITVSLSTIKEARLRLVQEGV